MIELAFAAALMAQDLSQPDFTHEEGLPWCDQLESDDRHEDCALQPTDGRDVVAVFTFTDGEWGQNGRMEVRTFEGRLLQAFDFETESFFYPSMEDINSDGRQDILVPLITGNVNTEYAIFMGTEDGFLHQPWQVSGFAVEAANADGLIIAQSRGSAVDSYAEFYRFDGETVSAEASVLISFANVDNPDDGPDCSLTDGGEAQDEAFYCGLAMDD